jgi:hypothetical protein
MSKKLKLLGKKYKFNFGKYKGTTIADVLNIQPGYIVWAHNTIPWFKVEKNIFDKAVDLDVEEKFQRAVRRNIRRMGSSMYDPSNNPYWFEDDNGSWLA